jgi:hypothetical protein
MHKEFDTADEALAVIEAWKVPPDDPVEYDAVLVGGHWAIAQFDRVTGEFDGYV